MRVRKYSSIFFKSQSDLAKFLFINVLQIATKHTLSIY